MVQKVEMDNVANAIFVDAWMVNIISWILVNYG